MLAIPDHGWGNYCYAGTEFQIRPSRGVQSFDDPVNLMLQILLLFNQTRLLARPWLKIEQLILEFQNKSLRSGETL